MSHLVYPTAAQLVWNPRAPKGIRDGLVFAGGMEFPGSTYYHDASGYGNAGTLINMDPATDWGWSAELGRPYLDFDGSDDWVGCGEVAQLNGLSFAALSGWLYGSGGNATVFGRTYYRKRFTLGVDGGKAYWSVENGGDSYPSSTPASVNGWHHYVMVFDGTQVEGLGRLACYVDGVPQSLSAGGGNPPSTTGTGAWPAHFTLGRGFPYNNYVYYAGPISEPLAFTRLLTTPEIQWLADPTHRLRVPWRRTVWPVGVVAGPTFNPAWAANVNTYIGLGA